PMSYPLEDVNALHDRRIKVDEWLQIVREAFDRLAADGAQSGRVLTLVLHPWLTGQAFRAEVVSDVLRYITASRNAWLATGGEIVNAYRTQALASRTQPSGPRLSKSGLPSSITSPAPY